MKDPKIYLMQVGAKALGFDPGPLDGEDGPKTQSAVSDFVASLVETVSIPVKLVTIAKGQLALNIRETSKNQGAEIAKFWSATSYPTGYANREPYCAAFVCWLVMQACASATFKFSLPTSALAYDFEKWAKANINKGIKFATTPQPGDIFTLATASHCGLVIAVNGNLISTIEANTDGSGSREGDGVYQRVRSIDSVRKFIRIC